MRCGAFFYGKEGRDDFRKKTLSILIHIIIILLMLPRSNMIHPFLNLEIPFYGLHDTLLKLERLFPTEFLLQLSRVNGVTHIVTLAVGYISDEIHILAFSSPHCRRFKTSANSGLLFNCFLPCTII